MREAATAPDLQKILPKPSCQDDAYLVGGLTEISRIWPSLRQALADGGHELNLLKSAIWLPGCDAIPTTELPDQVRHVFADLPRAFAVIKVMGNAAQQTLESFLTPYSKALQLANERLAKAQHLGDRIEDFLLGSTDACSVNVAWWFMAKFMREALACDIRIIPSE